MSSHAKCKSDIYFYSIYCIHTLNENIDLYWSCQFFFLPQDPHHVLSSHRPTPRSCHDFLIKLHICKMAAAKWQRKLLLEVNWCLDWDREWLYAPKVLICRASAPLPSPSQLLKFVRGVTPASRAVTFVVMETPKKQPGYSIMSDMSHMWGLRPNQMVLGSLHTYTCTHMSLPADAKESVLETIVYTYLNNVCLCHQCPRNGVLHYIGGSNLFW